MKLKLQGTTADSLYVAGAVKLYRNNVGTFCNVLQNVATENNLSDTTGNIFNFTGSSTQDNNCDKV
jgi:hypothetical protein